MIVVIQRVLHASVEVASSVVGSIENGYLLYIGIEKHDTSISIRTMAEKIRDLRINADDHDRMNLDIITSGGSVLAVSQFTLCADTTGRRPGFSNAAPPDTAKPLYDLFCTTLRSLGIPVSEGVFGARMTVTSKNDGPVTFILSR